MKTVLLLFLPVALLLIGCAHGFGLVYRTDINWPGESDFESTTEESLIDYDTTVAVVCYAPTEVKWDFQAIDSEIAGRVAGQMSAQGIQVIDPDRVRAWLDKHSQWNEPLKIGAALHATHVVYIELQSYHLYEKNSTQLFRGRAVAMVSVWKMDGDEGEKIYSKELTSLYPLKVARSVYEISYARFKKEYLIRLSEEIGHLFYWDYIDDDIKVAT